MEKQKLTQEEIKTLAQFQQSNNALIQELGQIGLAQINLEKRQENAEKYLDSLREEESAFAKELEEKYGTGSIDLEKGEFTPFEQTAQRTPATETDTAQ